MFAILFGLSMDYEVFLLSRIREEYLRTGNNGQAVADGLSATARVITAAAAIMCTFFLSFVLGDNIIIKLFGIGFASAIFIDATLIRMVIVPSTMELLGDANWWLPGWLDRILPHLDVEGPTRRTATTIRAADEPDDPDRARPRECRARTRARPTSRPSSWSVAATAESTRPRRSTPTPMSCSSSRKDAFVHNVASLRALVEPEFLPADVPALRQAARARARRARSRGRGRPASRRRWRRARRSPPTTSCSRPARRIRSRPRATLTTRATRSTSTAAAYGRLAPRRARVADRRGCGRHRARGRDQVDVARQARHPARRRRRRARRRRSAPTSAPSCARNSRRSASSSCSVRTARAAAHRADRARPVHRRPPSRSEHHGRHLVPVLRRQPGQRLPRRRPREARGADGFVQRRAHAAGRRSRQRVRDRRRVRPPTPRWPAAPAARPTSSPRTSAS